MTRLLVIDDDRQFLSAAQDALCQYHITTALSGSDALSRFSAGRFDAVVCDLGLPDMDGLEVVRAIRKGAPGTRVLLMAENGAANGLIASLRENIVDFLRKPFDADDLQTAVGNILASENDIQVLSASPVWIELLMPASFQMVARLGRFFEELHAEIDAVTRESISTAFRELLNNAIEHGCACDVRRNISICYLRLSNVILYRIKDPGPGFRMDSLPHAAICNPTQDPLRHMEERQRRGLRAGGFGLLCIQGIADELVYNERGNEVVFARYLNGFHKD